MTTHTEAIVLACPLCRVTIELDPYQYHESPCAGCGVPLVLAGGRRAGAVFEWWHFAVRCACGTCFRPGDVRQFASEPAVCPACGAVVGQQ